MRSKLLALWFLLVFSATAVAFSGGLAGASSDYRQTHWGPPCCLAWTTDSDYKTYNPYDYDYHGWVSADSPYCDTFIGWYYSSGWHTGASGEYWKCPGDYSSAYFVTSILTGTQLFVQGYNYSVTYLYLYW